MTTMQIIESVICTGEHILPELLHTKSRQTKLKETRQIIMYFGTKNKVTTIDASGYFGLDHATCVHACKVVDNYCSTEIKFAEKIGYYSAKIEKLSKVIEQINYFSALMKPLEGEIEQLEARLANLKTVAQDIKKQVELIFAINQ